jgi:predicted ArsR family transcriptional regulator
MIDREPGMQSTRQEILDILKQERQATVEDLAERLELTPMTIRHHLNVLQAQNLVMAAKVRRLQTVGRPRLVYTLTEAADDLFPQSYGELARHLVSEVKETMGPEGTQAMFERIAARMAEEAPPPAKGQTFEERLEQVTRFMNRLGFIFTWEKTEDGYLFTNVNCPYRRVSQEHAELCAMDTVLLNRLLGVEPRHVSQMREGSAACTCLLNPPSST